MSSERPVQTRRRRIAGERRAPVTLADRETPVRPETRARSTSPSTSQPPTRPPSRRRPARARPSRQSRGLVAGLAGLLVVLLVYIGLMLLGLLGSDGVADVSRAQDESAAARAAQGSAERAAEAVLAYDHRSLESDRDAATRFMTEDYAEEYVATFDSAVSKAAADSKAQVAVEVQGAAVLTASVDRARVLLFVDQTTLSSRSDQPRLALNRVEFQMVKQGDGWLVDDILSF